MDATTIEHLGNAGEFLAAVATLATLVYLARQIRQSNQIARWEAHRSSVVTFAETAGRIFEDADAARIWRQGLLEPDSLEKVDRVRLHHALSQAVLNFKDVLEAHDLGFYDTPTYVAWEGYTCAVLNTPGGDQWWAENSGSFIDRVREVIDRARPEVQSIADLSPYWWSVTPSKRSVKPSTRQSHTGAGRQP